MSDKRCCNIEVVETDKGVRVELTGEGLKERLARLCACCFGKEKASKRG